KHRVWVDVPEPEGANAGGVDDPARALAVGALDPQRERRRGCVPAASRDLVDVAGRAARARHERVYERGLTDARVPDHDRDLTHQFVSQRSSRLEPERALE